jgi:hypothetical protein
MTSGGGISAVAEPALQREAVLERLIASKVASRKMSQDAFAKVWDNPDDADYDRL